MWDTRGVRAYVIEVRRCMGTHTWIARADYTWGEWRATPWGADREFRLVKQDLQLLNPGYLVVWPEEPDAITGNSNMVWTDA